MSAPKIIDSPTGFVAEHIKTYVESNGAEGHIWRGVPTLLLTTLGRRSGVGRRTALIYGRDGDDYVIVASKGGSATHPLWYENLVKDPEVTVQVGAEIFTCTSATYGEDIENLTHRQKIWDEMVAIWPDFANYQVKTERRIPLVRLTRKTHSQKLTSCFAGFEIDGQNQKRRVRNCNANDRHKSLVNDKPSNWCEPKYIYCGY
jgi:deazaflavin-dependent oxidoreductase (nitroreductase family)